MLCDDWVVDVTDGGDDGYVMIRWLMLLMVMMIVM